jgi:hypothetical protein
MSLLDVKTRVCRVPRATEMTLCSGGMGRESLHGTDLWLSSPRPRAPRTLAPQAYNSPSLPMNTEW